MKAPSSSLFVYGTLMAPEVMKTLIGRLPPGQPATLSGYQRYPVKQHVFPGLVKQKDGIVKGILFQELQETEMKRLDFFEGPEYTKQTIRVQLEDGAFATSLVYEWANPVSELDVPRTWDYEHFLRYGLQNYLRNVVRPCKDELDSSMIE